MVLQLMWYPTKCVKMGKWVESVYCHGSDVADVTMGVLKSAFKIRSQVLIILATIRDGQQIKVEPFDVFKFEMTMFGIDICYCRSLQHVQKVLLNDTPVCAT